MIDNNTVQVFSNFYQQYSIAIAVFTILLGSASAYYGYYLHEMSILISGFIIGVIITLPITVLIVSSGQVYLLLIPVFIALIIAGISLGFARAVPALIMCFTFQFLASLATNSSIVMFWQESIAVNMAVINELSNNGNVGDVYKDYIQRAPITDWIIIFSGIIGGIIGYFLRKPAIIISTAAAGAALICFGLARFMVNTVDYTVYIENPLGNIGLMATIILACCFLTVFITGLRAQWIRHKSPSQTSSEIPPTQT